MKWIILIYIKRRGRLKVKKKSNKNFITLLHLQNNCFGSKPSYLDIYQFLTAKQNEHVTKPEVTEGYLKV
jgi:hypothetical protein